MARIEFEINKYSDGAKPAQMYVEISADLREEGLGVVTVEGDSLSEAIKNFDETLELINAVNQKEHRT